jgi:hypothetical protein
VQASRTSPGPRPEVSKEALGRAQAASRRARKVAQLRVGFTSRAATTAPMPPLARMLRGGRGGQVRLKLLMTFLWFQTDSTQAVPLAYPAQLWAQLLGLDDPAGAGTRRINEAQKWLEAHGFISIEAQPGHAHRITVLNETGDRSAYTPPGYAANRLRDTPQAAAHLYVQIPAEMWTNGYMSILSGAGLALYLILLDQYGPGKIADEPRHVWFSPKLFKERYGLSDDTRSKGVHELRDLGLIRISRQIINPEDFDLERVRNTYTLIPSTLEETASWHPAPWPLTSKEVRKEFFAGEDIA